MKSSHRIFLIAGIVLVTVQIIQAFFRGYTEHWILALGYPLIVAPFSFLAWNIALWLERYDNLFYNGIFCWLDF